MKNRRQIRSLVLVLGLSLVRQATALPLADSYPRVDSTTTGTSSQQRVQVIGDSITVGWFSDGTSYQKLANQLAGQGLRARVQASPGSTYWHWNNRRIPKQGGGYWPQDLFDLPAALGATHTVLALGTNDSTAYAMGLMNHDELANGILWGMTRAMSGTSRCVILVTPSTHQVAANLPNYGAAAVETANIMRFLAAVKNSQLGRTRFVVADWQAQSSNQPWYDAQFSPHYNTTGYANFRNFITWYSVLAKNGNLGC